MQEFKPTAGRQSRRRRHVLPKSSWAAIMSCLTASQLQLVTSFTQSGHHLQITVTALRRTYQLHVPMMQVGAVQLAPVSQAKRGPRLKRPSSTLEEAAQQYGLRVEQTSFQDQSGSLLQLTPEQETAMLAIMREATCLTQLHGKLSKEFGEAPTLQEWASAAKLSEKELTEVIAKGAEAKQIIIASSIPLVYKIVKDHYQYMVGQSLSLTREDLIQEGISGLIRAAELFQPEKGVAFRTYAWNWVREALQASLYSNGRLIRVPKRTIQDSAKYHRMLDQGAQDGQTMEEAVGGKRALKNLTSRVASMAATQQVLSLDQATLGDQQLVSIIPDKSGGGGGGLSEVRSELDQVMGQALSPRERQLLAMRFGLLDGSAKSIAQCAKQLFTSVKQAQKIEDASISKLRNFIEQSREHGSLAEYFC